MVWCAAECRAGRPRADSESEVAIVSDVSPPAMLPEPLNPNQHNQLNFYQSPGARIGNSYVSVTNNIHKDEVVRGRFLGLELISPLRANGLRCSVAVCLCWTLVITFGLAIYFLYIAICTNYPIDIGLNETWYLRRTDWQAIPPLSSYVTEYLKLPVSIAMVGHSATNNCTVRRDCITEVKAIQKVHLELYGDIGPNFLVGGEEGFVFEGAGANVKGDTTAGDDRKQISIMFLGDYTENIPNQAQLDNVATLLDVLVKHNILNMNYVLYGYCQLRTYTISPGPNIMRRLPEFPHWQNDYATTCLQNKQT